MIIMGIDNGLNGAFAWLKDGKASFRVMPTLKVKTNRTLDLLEVAKLLREVLPSHVFIERAHAMPGQGVTSMFTFGYGYGALMGMMSALKIPHTVVSAKTWQKVMFQGMVVSDTKRASELICKRLWPDETFTATARSFKAHDGICDALMIAEYGRRTLGCQS